ncbi:hypothetical protein COOONC_16431, partial [Cooperia oncophora]
LCSDSQNTAHPGNSWQISNGRTVVYKQDSLLQVPDDPQVKKRQRDLTESRRKVEYRPPALHYTDSATPAWMWSTTPQCTNDWSILLQPLSYIFLFLSSMINPILYAFLSKRFREAASDIFYCKKGFLSHLNRTRSRTRTIVSDLPEDSRGPNPQSVTIRLNRLR